LAQKASVDNMLYDYWIQIRNWLLIKLAGTSTIILNVEITGVVTLIGDSVLVRNTTVRNPQYGKMAVIAELMGEEAAQETADRIDAMYERMMSSAGG
jgi:hypothetical protein